MPKTYTRQRSHRIPTQKVRISPHTEKRKQTYIVYAFSVCVCTLVFHRHTPHDLYAANCSTFSVFRDTHPVCCMHVRVCAILPNPEKPVHNARRNCLQTHIYISTARCTLKVCIKSHQSVSRNPPRLSNKNSRRSTVKKTCTRPVDKQILRILFCLYTPLRKGRPAHSAMMVFHSTAMSDINHFPLAQGTLSQNAPTKRRDRRRRCDSITCARAFTRNERIAPSAWIDGMMMYTIWLGALSVGNQLLMTRSSTA